MVFRFASRRLVTSVASVFLLGLGLFQAGDARAQALDEDPVEEDDTESAESTPSTLVAPAAEKPHIGVGLRLRGVSVPEGLLELFVEDAAQGVSNFGIGLELSRRRGNFEVQFGVEYEKLDVGKGLWVEKGKSVMGQSVDFVEDDGFGWITAELTFLYHTPIIDQLSVRYGGGAGIGILQGEIVRTDQFCPTNDLDSCMNDTGQPNQQTPYDLPPVFPVVNAIIGVQIRPTNEIFINVETGIRTIPFFGATMGYYF